MIETQKQLAALLKERNDQNDAVVGAQPKPKAPQTPRGVKTPRSVSTDSKFTLSFEKVSQRSLDVFGFSLSDFGATSPEPTNSTNIHNEEPPIIYPRVVRQPRRAAARADSAAATARRAYP